MGSLGSKTALVTGASRAMGCTSAQTLASAGAHVIIHYGRGATEADALAADIRAAGGRAAQSRQTCRYRRAHPPWPKLSYLRVS
jgi:NAD(P)-dependent dehydrogenase (short-subunit alcohol dehydrogenase family)